MYLKHIASHDARLGRHVHHDPASKGFALPVTIDRKAWRSKSIRLYDPVPNPNQTVGCCTGCAKAMQLNAAGNRKAGQVLGMSTALTIYGTATQLDSIPGTYPGQDTGSTGLAAAKAAQRLGLGGTYSWLFGGVDEVVQAVMDGHTPNVGTEWDYDMFNPDSSGVVHRGGGVAGGHEWTVRGYDATRDLVLGRCWWGEFRDFWITRTDLDDLLANDGDAVVQVRATA